MKTQHRQSFVIYILALVITLCSACQRGNHAGKEESKVEPPEIDIHTAVLTGNQEALRQHLSAGTDINEKDPFGGSSPLITAALFNKQEEASILLEGGADINFQNNDGATALHVASFFCRADIVRLLLDHGADKNLKNRFGATPYQGVAGPFSEVKNTYDMLGKALQPMGLNLDYAYLEKTRPEIAEMLK